MTPETLAATFAALASPRRVSILRELLRSREPLASSSIAVICGLPESSASQNLKALFEAHLVERYSSGRWVFYRPDRKTLASLVRFWRLRPREGEPSDH